MLWWFLKWAGRFLSGPNHYKFAWIYLVHWIIRSTVKRDVNRTVDLIVTNIFLCISFESFSQKLPKKKNSETNGPMVNLREQFHFTCLTVFGSVNMSVSKSRIHLVVNMGWLDNAVYRRLWQEIYINHGSPPHYSSNSSSSFLYSSTCTISISSWFANKM